MIKSIYENSLDRLLRVEDHSVTTSREAPIFDVYPDPVESSNDSLDRTTNALAKIQLKSSKVILSQNYSTTFEKLLALMISRFNMVLPS